VRSQGDPGADAVQVIQERAREIKTLFPGWHVWHSSWSDTWNAHREGEEPDFRRPAGGRRFMVSTYDATDLVALLERQVGVDLKMEFPGWRVRREASGGWYAFPCERPGSRDCVVVRLVQDRFIVGVRSTLRALAHQETQSS
jgi:hypothetical protein